MTAQLVNYVHNYVSLVCIVPVYRARPSVVGFVQLPLPPLLLVMWEHKELQLIGYADIQFVYKVTLM